MIPEVDEYAPEIRLSWETEDPTTRGGPFCERNRKRKRKKPRRKKRARRVTGF